MYASQQQLDVLTGELKVILQNIDGAFQHFRKAIDETVTVVKQHQKQHEDATASLKELATKLEDMEKRFSHYELLLAHEVVNEISALHREKARV